MNAKVLQKSLARLTALKENLPSGTKVKERYPREFNEILEQLETETSEDLSEFKISESDIHPRVTSIERSGKKNYSSDNYCDRDYLLMKVDGVLGFFTMSLQPEKTESQIGFSIE